MAIKCALTGLARNESVQLEVNQNLRFRDFFVPTAAGLVDMVVV
jgi:hypothetical protein